MREKKCVPICLLVLFLLVSLSPISINQNTPVAAYELAGVSHSFLPSVMRNINKRAAPEDVNYIGVADTREGIVAFWQRENGRSINILLFQDASGMVFCSVDDWGVITRNNDVWKVPLRGGTGKQLTFTPELSEYDYALSPDCNYLAFMVYDIEGAAILILDLQESPTAAVVKEITRISVSRETIELVQSLRDKQLRKAGIDGEIVATLDGYLLDWTSGNDLLYTRYAPERHLAEIWSYSLGAHRSAPFLTFASDITNPTTFKHGAKVLFEAWGTGQVPFGFETPYGLYVLEGPFNIHSLGGYYLEFDWAPDGQDVAVVNMNGLSIIHELDPNQVEIIVSEGFPSGPAWSPDGGQIAYQQYNLSNGTTVVYVLDLETGAIESLNNFQEFSAWHFVWRPLYEKLPPTLTPAPVFSPTPDVLPTVIMPTPSLTPTLIPTGLPQPSPFPTPTFTPSWPERVIN